MEKVIVENMNSADSSISGFVLIRPSLLLDGQALGSSKVRVGTEMKPAVGYTIHRNDVGLWMYENLVEGDREKWAGQKVSLTY